MASLSLKNRYTCWPELEKHGATMQHASMQQMFAEDAQRAENFTVNAAGLQLDFSKNLINKKTLELFKQLAEQSNLGDAIQNLLAGEQVNNTEQRQALHTSLRGDNTSPHHKEIQETLDRMDHLVSAIHDGKWKGYSNKNITDVVNIGIGGSDLGPRMVVNALTPFHLQGIRVHFVSNIDPSDLNNVLASINPQTTLFIIASKSFTTLETLSNAKRARQWFCTESGQQDISKHFIAVSAKPDMCEDFGIDRGNVLPMWDWVGGRFSLWSAIGLPIALAIGMENFKQLLAGARQMDNHFSNSPTQENMPVLLALLGIWYHNVMHAESHVVLPYDHYLQLLPDFLQQLDMESNGKQVDRAGSDLDYTTGPILWGSVGTNGQHSFHQLLHQGTHLVPADFILPLTTFNAEKEQHRHLVANCLAQSEAMMMGKSQQQIAEELQQQGVNQEAAIELSSHKAVPGNRPHNIIYFEKLSPSILGALIALYEHKIFVQSVIWNTNAFDQWGVELGKQLGEKIVDALSETADYKTDSSTDALIKSYISANKRKK